MGKTGSRKRNRGYVKFPKNLSTALRVGARRNIPIIRQGRSNKGRPDPKGTRIQQYGLSQEEKLMQYAPEGSAPERMVFGWLMRHKFMFAFQQNALGGRAIPGGAVLDFVIFDKNPELVIRIQSYWHLGAGTQWSDDIQMGALMALGYQVEDVWEREVNTIDKVNNKMMQILYGQPKFGTVASMAGPGGCPFCGDSNCMRCSW